MKSSIAVRPGVQSLQPEERWVSCPHCHGGQQIKSEYMGLLFMCRNCGRTFRANPNEEPSFKVPHLRPPRKGSRRPCRCKPAPSYAPGGRRSAGPGSSSTPGWPTSRPISTSSGRPSWRPGSGGSKADLDARAVDHGTSLRQLREAKELLARARDQRHDLRGRLEPSQQRVSARDELAGATGGRARRDRSTTRRLFDRSMKAGSTRRVASTGSCGRRRRSRRSPGRAGGGQDRERDDRTSGHASDALERELDSVRLQARPAPHEIMAGASERERFDRAIGEIDAIRAERDRLEAKRQAGERREEQLRAEISEGGANPSRGDLAPPGSAGGARRRPGSVRAWRPVAPRGNRNDSEARPRRFGRDRRKPRARPGRWPRSETWRKSMPPTPWSGSWTPCAPSATGSRAEIMAGACASVSGSTGRSGSSTRSGRSGTGSRPERQAGERREEQLRAEVSEGERTLREATSGTRKHREELDAARRQFERGNESLHEEIERLRGEAEAVRKGV